MSKITNIIITGFGYNDKLLVNLIKICLRDLSCGSSTTTPTLKKVDEMAGGSYAMESDIWLGAVNYLDVQKFKKRVQFIIEEYQDSDISKLNHPSSLQIFIKEDESNSFQEFLI